MKAPHSNLGEELFSIGSALVYAADSSNSMRNEQANDYSYKDGVNNDISTGQYHLLPPINVHNITTPLVSLVQLSPPYLGHLLW